MNKSCSFGQLVIGPPGSGKTTYCHGIQQFYKQTGRPTVVINLDPANDTLPYECGINISDLITVNDVMEKFNLGPNGALIYCMEFIEANFDWLKKELKKFSDHYLVFDCPGQVELYTHDDSVSKIIRNLENLNVRLSAVHLVDSHHCIDASTFIAVTLTSLVTMLKIALPTVHVLSKIDLIENDDKLPFLTDYYTQVSNLDYLLELLPESPFMAKHKKLNRLIAGVIEDNGLVSFVPLNIQDKESVIFALKLIDKANGYVYNSNEY